jgi:hypothetical protein
MDPPGQRGWTEYPFDLSWRLRLYLSELAFEVLAAYGIALHRVPDLLMCAQRGIRAAHVAHRPNRRERS